MEFPEKVWNDYALAQNRISTRAKSAMRRWLDENGTGDRAAMTERAYALSTTYGEASAALACEMYDAVAVLEGAELPPAEPAPTATWEETSDAVYGAADRSRNLEYLSGVVGRLVKQAGADTTLRNAARDHAEFAWIPMGTETCAFCIALASRGWQPASGDLSGGHAEHIHENCFCEFAVRHDRGTRFPGFDPQKYLDMYYGADLDGERPTAANRVNALRRELYGSNRERINAQKRSAYAKRRELESSAAEELKT